ncbi:MAG: Rpn family recombination-promoting nuclease/putative transposase [Lachnospiraceae bacterium]|nr:Rpn family recombination-promoting nuclease/putative transposase [Lachnospiraceae bacterium]
MYKSKNATIGTRLTDMSRRLRYGRKYRDSFFCGLFGSDKKALLELYNALNNSDYDNLNDIEVVTIENAIYITSKNDVAYLLNGTINLYEHQSTHNPNMPVRFLIYLAQEYQKYLAAQSKSAEYGKYRITLPTPKCVVFYNGEEEEPERYELRLSDAFANKEVEADAELIAHVYNINSGHNAELMSKCKTLYGYSILIDKITIYKKSMKLKPAIERAIEECIKEDILKNFLKSHRGEVLGSLLTDFDRKKYERTVFSDGYENCKEKDIQLLMKHLISDNSSLSEEEAISKARMILSD